MRGAARGRVLYPDTVAGAKPGGMDLVVGRVGEGGPCARMPDSEARNRLAFENTAGARPQVYGRRRWGGGDRPASRLAVSGRSSRVRAGAVCAQRLPVCDETFSRGRCPHKEVGWGCLFCVNAGKRCLWTDRKIGPVRWNHESNGSPLRRDQTPPVLQGG